MDTSFRFNGYGVGVGEGVTAGVNAAWLPTTDVVETVCPQSLMYPALEKKKRKQCV